MPRTRKIIGKYYGSKTLEDYDKLSVHYKQPTKWKSKIFIND